MTDFNDDLSSYLSTIEEKIIDLKKELSKLLEENQSLRDLSNQNQKKLNQLKGVIDTIKHLEENVLHNVGILSDVFETSKNDTFSFSDGNFKEIDNKRDIFLGKSKWAIDETSFDEAIFSKNTFSHDDSELNTNSEEDISKDQSDSIHDISKKYMFPKKNIKDLL